ncbi:DUF6888 family protein [Cylindrospermum sp. FACHB-282]|uniref:DUF6888 family protein n=1 Tax=Cylindrospermum sp. FACHB-282 TaxID=2692794 RepID=UPI0035CD091A
MGFVPQPNLHTKLYLPINLVRVDKRTGNVFILASEENMIEIYPNAKWRYLV